MEVCVTGAVQADLKKWDNNNTKSQVCRKVDKFYKTIENKLSAGKNLQIGMVKVAELYHPWEYLIS